MPSQITHTERGELNVLLDRHLNTGSTGWRGKFPHFLYRAVEDGGCGLPTQYIKEGSRNTDRPACDVDALLKLYRMVKRGDRTCNTAHPQAERVLTIALQLSNKLAQREMLETKVDGDGRFRFSVVITGSETGRCITKGSKLGTGYGPQTTPPAHRHLFLADEGCWMGKRDLRGADGWTIGCECAALGDPTMLEDCRAGLNPVDVVTRMFLEGAQVNKMDRAALKAMIAQPLPQERKWVRQANKRVVWSVTYGAGEVAMSDQIMQDSYKLSGVPMYVPPSTCRTLKGLVLTRYPGIELRQSWINEILVSDGALTGASGQRRVFFGRKDNHEVQKDAYATTPQMNTTYATKLAWRRAWEDPENVREDGSRVCRVWCQRHDELDVEFPKDRVEWISRKLDQWFDNPLTIAGYTVVIPSTGAYGRSWGELTEGVL